MAETPQDAGWKWFPGVKNGWSLDVVTLLAVIGESSMAEHSQAMTASLLCLLPRIIPAPQALLKPARPGRMPETHARMTGVYSGTTLDSVGFFANIIEPLDDRPPFGFKVLEIRHAHLDMDLAQASPASPASPAGLSRRKRDAPDPDPHPHPHPHCGPPRASVDVDIDAEMNPTPRPLVRRPTARERVQDMLANPTLANRTAPPAVPAKLFSPIHVLSVFSCLLSIAIIVSAVFWEDGTAILAVTLISLASSVVGGASFWHPILMNRKQTNEVPKGDVMIRTREGAFVLIRCTEDVARELYSGTEECKYAVDGKTYRLLMAIGTTLLMLSVVLLGNCTWNSQMFIGGSYIVLNFLYWALGMIPKSYFWDLSRYVREDVTPPDARNAHEETDANDARQGFPSFTRTLWYAIRETGLTGWVERSGAAPGTQQWKKWLKEAEREAKRGNRSWNAVERKNQIMKEKDLDGDGADHAAQHAPATEVQGPLSAELSMNQGASF